MNNMYVLCGFINVFNVIPAFVTPVFKKENLYYIQYVENNKVVLDTFSSFSDSDYLSKVKFYDVSNFKYKIFDLDRGILVKNINKNGIINNLSYNLKDSVFGFQMETSIVYGQIHAFMTFLNAFKTNDKYLKEEIYDFKESFAELKNSNQIYSLRRIKNRNDDLKYKLEDIVKDFENMNERLLQDKLLLETLDRQSKNNIFFTVKYRNLMQSIHKLLVKNRAWNENILRIIHGYNNK